MTDKQDKGLTAKDTVLGLEIVSPKFPDYIPCAVWDVLERQAEITWDKAKAHYEPLIERERKATNSWLEAYQKRVRELEDKIQKAFKEGIDKAHKACDETYGEMLKIERKRIITYLREHNKYPQCKGLVLTVKDWQALKGGN